MAANALRGLDYVRAPDETALSKELTWMQDSFNGQRVNPPEVSPILDAYIDNRNKTEEAQQAQAIYYLLETQFGTPAGQELLQNLEKSYKQHYKKAEKQHEQAARTEVLLGTTLTRLENFLQDGLATGAIRPGEPKYFGKYNQFELQVYQGNKVAISRGDDTLFTGEATAKGLTPTKPMKLEDLKAINSGLNAKHRFRNFVSHVFKAGVNAAVQTISGESPQSEVRQLEGANARAPYSRSPAIRSGRNELGD